MNDKQGVRVEQPTENPKETSVQDGQDYASILNENLGFLQEIRTLQAKIIAGEAQTKAATQAKSEAENKYRELLEKHRNPGGYRKGRRVVMGLHVTLSVFSMLLGILLWLKSSIGVEGFWFTGVGVLWLLIVSICIHNLADRER